MSRVVFAETVRRHLTSPPYFIFIALVGVIAAIAGGMNGSPRTWQGIGSLLVYILGCQLIGPEFSSGTLQLILSKPVNRTTYLLSRFAGVLVTVWIALAIPFLIDAGGRAFVYDGPAEWQPLLMSSLNTATEAALICALLALFGSFTRSYFNVALYFVLDLGISMLDAAARWVANANGRGFGWMSEFLRRHPAIVRSIGTINENLFPSTPESFDLKWTALVVTNAAIALLAASYIFRSREVPYGAD